MKTSALIALALAVSLTACDQAPPPQYVQQPAPQYQQYPQTAPQPYQQPQVVQQQGIGTGTAIVGAAAVGTAAYLIGKNSGEKNAAAAQQRQVVTTPQPVTQAPQPQKFITQPAVVTKPVQAAPAPAPQQTFKPQSAKNSVTVTPPRTSSSFSVSKRK